MEVRSWVNEKLFLPGKKRGKLELEGQ